MKTKLSFGSFLGLGLLLATCGCAWVVLKDHAIVTDRVAAYSNPHVVVDPSFELTEVDGRTVERASTVPTLSRPMVLPGHHVFKADLKLGYQHWNISEQERSELGLRGKKEVTFEATVEAGKVYLIYWKDGRPALLEVPKR